MVDLSPGTFVQFQSLKFREFQSSLVKPAQKIPEDKKGPEDSLEAKRDSIDETLLKFIDAFETLPE